MKAKWIVFMLTAVPLALTQPGCLFIAGAGVGAAGFAYHEGKLRHFFPYPLDAVYSATQQALADLRLNVTHCGCDSFSGRVTARDAADRKISIELEPKGIGTKIGIRVGTFGDEAVSHSILRQIELRLSPPLPALPPSPASASPGRLEPVPLAPPQPPE